MSEYLFRLEVYDATREKVEDQSRVAILEHKSESFPYLREGASDVVWLIPPHPEFGRIRAKVECDVITDDRPYVAMRLECAHGKGKAVADHLRNSGWKNMTTPVIVYNI